MKMPRRFVVLRALAVLGPLATTPLAAQTWTATNLHPTTATDSTLRATTGTQQVGSATIGGISRGGIWGGTRTSFTFTTTSLFTATTGTQQAGYALLGADRRAVVRNGTTGALTFRNPGASTFSEIYASVGTQQAGYAYIDGYHAAVWTAPNFGLQDLHPFGAQASEAFATTGTQQAGYVAIDGVTRATLWAPFRIDLHPAAASSSGIYAMAGSSQGVGQQAGYATLGGFSHASVWAGARSSFRDLHPVGATRSILYATTGRLQAGSATIGGSSHAGFWANSAATFVDLHRFLPAGYQTSLARGIWTDGSAILVAGSAYNSAAARSEAILWRFTPNRAPTLAIVAKSTRPTTRARVTIRGTRADPDGTTPQVFVKIGKGRFRPAKGGSANWTFSARLEVGRNPVQIYAQDAGGLRSPIRRLKILRRP